MNEFENEMETSSAELGSEPKPKLAFIDDEQRILRSMKLLFRKTHDVFITTDPTEYIDYIKNNHVHVAVSDQRMPERVGVDILREVKEVYTAAAIEQVTGGLLLKPSAPLVKKIGVVTTKL